MKADRGPTRRARKVASGARWRRTSRPRRPSRPGWPRRWSRPAEPEPAVPARSQQPAEPLEPAALRVLAKPPVRKLAKDLGIDLATITPTGPNGTVTRSDVETAHPGVYVEETVIRPRHPGCPDVDRRAHRRARDPRADQGRPQDDGRRDGAVGVLRAPRHRVGDRRRDPHRRVRRAAQGAPRVPRREGLAAAGAGPGRDAGDAAYAGGQLVLGRGGPGGRLQALRQPRHRRGHPARPGRPQHQGRPGPLAGRPGHGAGRADRRSRARARPSRRR